MSLLSNARLRAGKMQISNGGRSLITGISRKRLSGMKMNFTGLGRFWRSHVRPVIDWTIRRNRKGLVVSVDSEPQPTKSAAQDVSFRNLHFCRVYCLADMGSVHEADFERLKQLLSTSTWSLKIRVQLVCGGDPHQVHVSFDLKVPVTASYREIINYLTIVWELYSKPMAASHIRCHLGELQYAGKIEGFQILREDFHWRMDFRSK